MKNDIKVKIEKVLIKNFYSEQDVVYFLVESYKFLEQEGRLDKFRVIKFYRNWACHHLLSKNIDKIFEEVYILIKAEKYFKKISGKPWIDLVNDEIEKSFKKFSPIKLKDEIDKFVTLFNFSVKLNWKSFREGLYGVVVDSPLLIVEKKENIFIFKFSEVRDISKFDDLNFLAICPKNNATFLFTSNDESFSNDE